MTTLDKARWVRFIQFVDDLRAVCDKHHAVMIHTPEDILVKVQAEDGGEVYNAGVILGISPGRTQYGHAEEGR